MGMQKIDLQGEPSAMPSLVRKGREINFEEQKKNNFEKYNVN